MSYTEKLKSGLYDCDGAIGRRSEGGIMDWIEINGTWYYATDGSDYFSMLDTPLVLPEEYML